MYVQNLITHIKITLKNLAIGDRKFHSLISILINQIN